MRFLVHKRRSAPAVIIVALVDVLIVLLIFLMVTTTFKQQSTLKLKLPESSQATKLGANENPRFVVNIDKRAGTNYYYYFNESNIPKTTEQMTAELVAQAAKNTNLNLAIAADKNAPWQMIVRVRDAAAEAKINTIVAYMKEKTKP